MKASTIASVLALAVSAKAASNSNQGNPNSEVWTQLNGKVRGEQRSSRNEVHIDPELTMALALAWGTDQACDLSDVGEPLL
jgi:hypothetical protein